MRLLIFIIISVLLIAAPSYAETKIILASGGAVLGKVSSLVLTEAYKRAGIDFEIKEISSVERVLVESNSGRLDGEVNRLPVIEKKYANLIRVPTPINIMETVVFTKNKTFVVNGWDSIRPYSIVIRKGVKHLESNTMGMNVKKFTTNDQLFKVISNDRYDICVNPRLNGLSEIRKQKLASIKVLEPPLDIKPMYHYLHKKHKDLVPVINKVLLEMQEKGEIERIRIRYIESILK